jgi:SAM-dependent methyltransferase
MSVDAQTGTGRDLLAENRRYYDSLWTDAKLVEPHRFNTWPLVQSLLPASGRCLEIAPGLRPRLPIQGTRFVDISAPALAKLHARGAQVSQCQISSLPFADGAFDLVCALDIIEHVEDDEGALSELARVTSDGGALLLSTPLHAAHWTPFDDFVGHKRRYEPAELLEKLARHHITLERSAVYGMQPRSSRLLDWGMWWLVNRREQAMRWYNRVFMPLGLWFQKKLQFTPGLGPTEGVDEVLLVCTRTARAQAPAPRAVPAELVRS